MAERVRDQRPGLSELRRHWMLDPKVVFLNHGSFGATPLVVLGAQRRYRDQMEAEPVRFMVRELERLIDEARRQAADFLGADPEGFAFVQNATAGVNAVLRSLSLRPGDELITTNHEYNASRNALDYVAEQSGARVVIAGIPFPLSDSARVVSSIVDCFSERTRLLLVDHITSQTGLILPLQSIAEKAAERGIDVLVDGAHAPGMVPLDLRSLPVSWYTGNFHKWVCAPKGAGFLWSREDRRDVRPTSISHGANTTRRDRSRYWIEFDWTGTFDPTAWLAVVDAIRFVRSLFPGGWPEMIRRNRELTIRARRLLCETLEISPPAPEEMLGSLAAVPLPDGSARVASALYGDPIQDALLDRYGIEVPVVAWPSPPNRVLRISAAAYNHEGEYEYLCAALRELLAEEAKERRG